MSTSEDQSLARIRRIAEYYRGADWALNYESAQGGAWSMKIMPPPDPNEDEAPAESPFPFFGPREYPVFAMRCEEIIIIAEALEHWHARVLMRLPSQEEGS